MATSERSYSDRQARAVVLKSAIAGFSPAYAPANADLGVMLFGSFVDSVATANDDVETAKTDWASAVTSRAADAKTAQKLTTQIISYVKSNAAWNQQLPRIKQLADKVRGITTRAKITPPPAPEPGEPAPPPAKKRDRGDQSYADIATSFKALADAVGKLAGYTPPDSAISATNLATLATTLRTNNDSVAAKDTDLDGAQRARFAIFFTGEGCLQVKFQAVKNAVKGQYGQDSPQFAEVKGIRW